MKQCLIVDDSSVIRKVARRIMEEANFAISEAENGQEALDVCRANLPDVVLLDWNMPVMDGLEFLAELRQNSRWAQVPVIVVTEKELTEDDRDLLNMQAQRIIQKAYHTPSDLAGQIKDLLIAHIK